MRIFSSTTRTISRRRSSRTRWVLGLLITGVVLGVILFTPVARFAGSLVAAVFAPAEGAMAQISDGSSFLGALLRPKSSIIEERDALRTALEDREAELASLKMEIPDYDMLRSIREGSSGERIIAGILARPNQTPYDTLIIDRGRQDGIAEGALVYARGNVAIGSVRRVDEKTALIILFSAPGIDSLAYVHGADVLVRAEGMGGGIIKVAIPQGLSVEEGASVSLPTLSPAIFGTISRISSDPAEPDMYGFVSNPVALSSLRFVSISKDSFTPLDTAGIEENIRSASADLSRFFNAPEDLIVDTSTATSSVGDE